MCLDFYPLCDSGPFLVEDFDMFYPFVMVSVFFVIPAFRATEEINCANSAVLMFFADMLMIK